MHSSEASQAYHVGESPDARSIATARSHGIVISQQTCRQLCSHDFYEFTHIVAMDRDNLSDIKRRCPTNSSRRIANLHLFSEFIPKHSYTTADVPDPYYVRQVVGHCRVDVAEFGCRVEIPGSRMCSRCSPTEWTR